MKPKPNPFLPQRPCPPELFVNRENILESFKQAVELSLVNFEKGICSPHNFLVVGEWGMGKSSLILKLEDILNKEFAGEDIYATEVHPSDTGGESNFYESIINSFASNRLRDKLTKIKSVGISIGPGGGQIEFKAGNIEAEFSKKLEAIWKELCKKKVKLVIIFIDDLQNVSDTILRFRNIFQDMQRKCNVLVAATSLQELITSGGNMEPLKRFFVYRHRLKPFDFEQTKRSIRVPISRFGLKLRFSPEVLKTLYDITQGHPSMINKTMFNLVNASASNEVHSIDKKFFHKHNAQILSALNELFEDKLDSCTEKELDTLKKISKTKKEVFRPRDIKVGASYIKQLESKEIVRKIRYGEYRLFHPRFRDYLSRLKW